MKLINNTYLFCLSMVILFISCATPRPVVRMNPVSENVKWNYGQAYASDTVTGIVVEAAFDKATTEYNIFDVSVTNNSNMDYLVDPASFYFENVTSGTGRSNAIKAIDPENMLLILDKQVSQNEADAKNAAIGAGIAGGALIAASVAVAATNNDRHHPYREPDPDLLLAAPIVIDAAANESAGCGSSIDQQREMWTTKAIRKTTLEPGYKIEGKIFFPRFEKPGTYLLKVPVDDMNIEIKFVQLNYFPK